MKENIITLHSETETKAFESRNGNGKALFDIFSYVLRGTSLHYTDCLFLVVPNFLFGVRVHDGRKPIATFILAIVMIGCI